MKPTVTQLWRKHLKHIPGLVPRNQKLLIKPFDVMVKGFWFEPITYDSFYLNTFTIGFAVPSNGFGYSLAEKIARGKSERWHLPQNEEECMDLLANLFIPYYKGQKGYEGLRDLTSEAQKHRAFGEHSYHIKEQLAYAMIMTGDYAGAREQLECAIEQRAPNIAASSTEEQYVARFRLMLTLLDREPRDAMDQIHRWERFTRRQMVRNRIYQ